VTALNLALDLRRGDFTLQVTQALPLSGLTAISGPSGAGKSTLLRVIAGFERGAGRISFGTEVWENGTTFVPPHRRRVATVFQDARLFPHLDVAGNLAYAARRAGGRADMAGVIARLDLGTLLPRRATGLSGGEAQRVALGRALLTAPRLILMDEPLSALDAARRAEILPMIEALRDEGGTPILYVSHAIAEVARLATQVLALSGGRVAAFGPADRILSDSAIGAALADGREGSIISARVGPRADDGLWTLETGGGPLVTPEMPGREGQNVRLFVPARDVMVATEPPHGLSALNILPARVVAVEPGGEASADVQLACGDISLRARITRRSVTALGLAPGTPCYAIVKSVALATG
jgi:molybdate transport system ATP-binding protein